MPTQMFLVVALQEYITVVFLTVTPMIRISRAVIVDAAGRRAPSFAYSTLLLLFVSIVNARLIGRHGLDLFPVLQRSYQIPDEIADFLVAPIVAQTIEQYDASAILDVDLPPASSELTVLQHLLPASPAKRQESSLDLEALAASPIAVNHFSLAWHVFVEEFACLFVELVFAFLPCGD